MELEDYMEPEKKQVISDWNPSASFEPVEMKKSKLLSVCFLIVISFFVSAPVQAQIEVEPMDNFGDVPVGDYASAFLTIMNSGCEPYFITSLGINGNGDFGLKDPFSPCEIHNGEEIDIGVIFTPSVLGHATAEIAINWTNGGCGVSYVLLTGVGVEAQPAPVTIEDILSFFDASAANITIAGEGSGNSAGNKLNALRNMLVKVSYFISEGNYEDACEQLNDVYIHCDGQLNPPDFVQGPSTATLCSMVLDLMQIMGCL